MVFPDDKEPPAACQRCPCWRHMQDMIEAKKEDEARMRGAIIELEILLRSALKHAGALRGCPPPPRGL
jgi:hypothetical protein